MKDDCHVWPVGRVIRDHGKTYIEMKEEHLPGLLGIEGFSHLEITWWCHELDTAEHRRTHQFDPPFPAPRLGVFASRAPFRPNPLATSVVPLIGLDIEHGRVLIGAIDAYTKTPVIDLKPYMPMYSRVRKPNVPEWAAGWPEWTPDDGIEPDGIPNN